MRFTFKIFKLERYRYTRGQAMICLSLIVMSPFDSNLKKGSGSGSILRMNKFNILECN
jgi:hypothetical protein